MSGTLAQLGWLSTHATEIFRNLFELSREVHEKVENISARTARLVEALPATEQHVEELGEEIMMRQSARLDRQGHAAMSMFVGTMPASIRTQYDSDLMSRMPEFAAIEEFLPSEAATAAANAGGSIADKYSNPGFFNDMWQKEELARIERLQEEKRQRRAERYARRGKSKGGASSNSQREGAMNQLVINAKGLNWRERYAGDDVQKPSASVVSASAEAEASARAELVSRRASVEIEIGRHSADMTQPPVAPSSPSADETAAQAPPTFAPPGAAGARPDSQRNE